MVITDYNGNVIPWDKTRHEALRAGYNVNCTNCNNCYKCTNCTNCYSCSKCTNCKNLTGADEQAIQPIQLITPEYLITIGKTHITIGCQHHSIEDWMTFDDDTITNMDSPSPLPWWKTWKPVIKSILEAR